MKALHLRKSSSLFFITGLNTVLLIERSLTAAMLYISSASVMLVCWQNLSKLTNQRVYQILVYRNDLLLSLPTGVLSLPLTALFFIFSRTVFYIAPRLTEHLEEAIWIDTKIIVLNRIEEDKIEAFSQREKACIYYLIIRKLFLPKTLSGHT